MIVKTWRNAKAEAENPVYGISIKTSDRDEYFKRNWSSVFIQIDSEVVEIILSSAFWTTCNELRDNLIKEFILENNLGSWKKGIPNNLKLTPIKDRWFKLELTEME